MTPDQNYRALKAIILATPPCQDSPGPLACASCLAQALTQDGVTAPEGSTPPPIKKWD
jgi:hypothetical protein